MSKKVFIDTNPIIYLVSQQEPYYSKVLAVFSDYISEDVEFYTSTITDAEFLVHPLSEDDSEQIENYRDFLKKLGFLKCFVSEQIAEKAARLRVKYKNIKLPDAIQLAASIDCSCDVFLTNDKRLKQVVEANVVYLDDM